MLTDPTLYVMFICSWGVVLLRRMAIPLPAVRYFLRYTPTSPGLMAWRKDFMDLFGIRPIEARLRALERHVAALNHNLGRIADLYQDTLTLQGFRQPLREAVEEGEVLWTDRTEREEFEEQIKTKDQEELEEKAKHANYLRELEAEALRLSKLSGFAPGAGPEGAEDSPQADEAGGDDGTGPPPRIEGFSGGEEQEE